MLHDSLRVHEFSADRLDSALAPWSLGRTLGHMDAGCLGPRRARNPQPACADALEAAVMAQCDERKPFVLLLLAMREIALLGTGDACPMRERVGPFLSARLMETVRRGDRVIWGGGETLALIMKGVISPTKVGCLAERVRRLASRPLAIDGTEIQVATVVGHAIYPQEAIGAWDLLRAAERSFRGERSR